MTDCVFKDHFEKKSAIGMCDICEKPFCEECRGNLHNTCYLCDEKVRGWVEQKWSQGELNGFKEIRNRLRKFNAFVTYKKEDFQDALQEISEILEKYGF